MYTDSLHPFNVQALPIVVPVSLKTATCGPLIHTMTDLWTYRTSKTH